MPWTLPSFLKLDGGVFSTNTCSWDTDCRLYVRFVGLHCPRSIMAKKSLWVSSCWTGMSMKDCSLNAGNFEIDRTVFSKLIALTLFLKLLFKVWKICCPDWNLGQEQFDIVVASDVLLACCGAPEALPAVLARRLKRTGPSRALLLNVLRSIRPQLSLGMVHVAIWVFFASRTECVGGPVAQGNIHSRGMGGGGKSGKKRGNTSSPKIYLFPLFGEINKSNQLHTALLVSNLHGW